MPAAFQPKKRPVRLSRTVLSSLMMPQDANPRGKVFGGSILKLIDNAAYVAACRHASAASCVTVSIERVDFKVPIEIGELVILEAQVNFTGRSSIEVSVEVFSEDLTTGARRHTNSCLVTLVAVNPQGNPVKVRGVLAETNEEKTRFRFAQARYRSRNE